MHTRDGGERQGRTREAEGEREKGGSLGSSYRS